VIDYITTRVPTVSLSNKPAARLKVLIVLLPVGMFFVFLLSILSYGTPGFVVDKTQRGLLVSRVHDSRTPVKKGDLIVAINDLGYQDILPWLLIKKPYPAGAYRIGLLRHHQPLSVRPKMAIVLPFRLVSVAWPRILLIFILLSLGILAFLRAPEDQPRFLFLLSLCAFATSFSATLPSLFGVLEPAVISLSFLTLAISNWIAFGAYLHFVFKFPVGRDLVKQRPWLIGLFYLGPALASLSGAIVLSGGGEDFWGWLERLRNIALPAMALAAFAKHVADYRRVTFSLEKNQLKLILNAYWLSFGPYFFLYGIPNIVFDHPIISFRIVVLSGMIMPIAYFVALARYRLLDVDKMISRTVAYFFLIALLCLSYSLLVIALKRWFIGMAVFSEELFLIYVIAVAVLFGPMVKGISFILDQVFQPKILYRYDMLPALSRRIGSCVLLKDLISILTAVIPRDFQLTGTCLARFDSRETRIFPEYPGLGPLLSPQGPIRQLFSGTAGYQFTKDAVLGTPFQRDLTLMEEAGFELIFPLRGGEGVLGLFLLGKRRDRRPFTRRDIDIFTTISNHAGVTLENTLRYESVMESKKQVEEMFARLVESKKLAALGEMSAVLAHELKNPLSIIRSSAQHMKNPQMDPEHTHELLEYIIDEVDGLTVVINNMLGLARYRRPVFSVVDLETEMRQMMALWLASGNHRREVALILRFPDHVPSICADFRQLQQVFLNCITNAEDAMPQGGKIEIAVTGADNKTVRIDIMDNGPGIPTEHIEDAFKKFYTTKEKGMGIGLAVSRQIVEAHNGTIDIANRDGGGLKVAITLLIDPLGTLSPALSRLAPDLKNR
jgi:signal transduction histidine kinase